MHSSEPQKREETFDAYIDRATARAEGKRQHERNGQELAGFKSRCLHDDFVVPSMAH